MVARNCWTISEPVKSVQSAILNLPYPPSANRLWRMAGQGKAPFKSAEYSSWLSHAGLLVNSQKPGCVEGPYALHIAAGKPDNRQRDIDNLIKPIGDLLQAAGVVTNDYLCQSVSAEWVTGIEGVRVSIVSTQMVAA